MSNERYTKNRNLWKKVYPVTKQKPRVQEFVANQITYSIDLGSFQRERSLFKIQPDYGQYQTSSNVPIIPPVVWEDGKFLITSSTPNLEYTFQFSQSFSAPPVVSLGIISDLIVNPNLLYPNAADILLQSFTYYNNSPVKIFGIGSPSTNSITFRLSAPYTGSIHYFALDSNVATQVPVNLTYWTPGSYQASGGKVTASLTQPNCTVTVAWDPITVTTNTPDVYVTAMPYLPDSNGPVIFPEWNFYYLDNYNPFYPQPLSLSGDDIAFTSSGSIVLHYIAIALSQSGGGGGGGMG